jgi:hypothetical protein
MEQFEKVRKGLQTAVDSDWMWQKAYYIAMICKDALALINAQQERIKELEAARTPRLLTLEEIRALPLGAVIWLEYKAVDEDGITDISLHPVMRSVCCGDAVLCDGESQTRIDTITLEPEECGIMERYWSARPTDDQRKAATWE